MSDMLEALRERLDLCQKWKLLVNRVISSDHHTLIGKKTKQNKKFRFYDVESLCCLDFDDLEKHTTSGVLCLRDDIRVKMEEKLAEAIECRQIAKNILKRITCK